MKIGFDISAQSLPRSGIGRYQHQLLNAMMALDAGNEFDLYAFNFRNRERFKQIKFETSNYKVSVIPIPQRVSTAWWLLNQRPGLERMVGDSDLYQVSELCIQPTKKAKTVAFVHDLTTLHHPQHHVWSNRFLHNQRFKRLSRVDGVLTNSEATKNDLISVLNLDEEKIFVTPLGADASFQPMTDVQIAPVLDKIGLQKPYLLFVGTLEPRKNVQNLVKVFNQLKQKVQIPHQLVLVGQKGWLFEAILTEVEQSPYCDEIVITDYVADSDLPALMNGADVFVYPSFYEGFGLPVLEAMQCGVPVVTSNISALPEVGGDAVAYCNPNDSQTLYQAIYKVISDQDHAKTLSEKGLVRSRYFSWNACAKKTLAAYSEVIGR